MVTKNKTDEAFEEVEKIAEEKEDFEYIASKNLPDGTLIEMLYDEDESTTSLAVCKNGEIKIMPDYMHKGMKLKPHLPNLGVLTNNVLLLPSEPAEYESMEALVAEVQLFINQYISISDFYEKIASYYVLFSWIHDDFNELPYLRVLGDYGTGKSRFLQVVGSICYKPIFTGGATTVSPIFRILNEFKGTLILDEADFKLSDTTQDIVKILNSGFMKGMPVLRSEVNGKKGFDVKAFSVFGPKIIATRELYKDSALESRMITEDMSLAEKREDIPCNIPDSFRTDALKLRNKLLMFRFKEKGTHKLNTALSNQNIESRLNQISLPLMSIIEDPKIRAEIKKYLEDYNETIKHDRTLGYNYQILEAICTLLDKNYEQPTVKEITDEYNRTLETSDCIKYKKMGWLIRKKLNLRMGRDSRGFFVTVDNKEKIEKLRKRLGIPENIYIH